MTQENNSKTTLDDRNRVFENPNQYARTASIEVNDGIATIHGYQEFILTKNSVSVLAVDENLQSKFLLLQPYFTQHYLQDRSFLDLGANGGFFSFLASQNGSSNITALDMDENYLNIIKKGCETLGFQNINIVNSNFSDWNQSAGVVLALAFIHWIYSCTSEFGSLDASIEKLANLTEYLLIIEWVEPTDKAIEFFHHTQWNQQIIREPYTFSAFVDALTKYFDHYELIGEISPTRRIFAAYKTKHVLDYSCPFPLLYPKEKLISSRCISSNPSSGILLWSCVYHLGDKICKQASLDLAEREANFLNCLQGSEYFPHLLEGGNNYGEYSTIYYEAVVGKPAFDVVFDLTETPQSFYQFVLHSLNCIEQLHSKGIIHRDIQPENILIRDEKPVLIDFGWAISNEYPYMTPPGLSDKKTPPDGSFSNVYQMGIILEKINNHKYSFFDFVFSRMTDPEASTRTEDIGTLRRLFDLVYHNYYSKNLGSVLMDDPSKNLDNDLLILMRILYEKTQELDILINEKKDLSAQVAKHNQTSLTLIAQMAEREQAIQTLTAQVAERDQVVQSLTAQVTEHKQTIQYLNTLAVEREQAVQTLTAQVTESEQAIQTLTAQVVEHEQTVQTLTAQVTEREQAIQTLTTQVTEREQTIQTLTTQMEESEQAIQTLTAQINQVTNELDKTKIEVVNYALSRSWRITRPLRKLKGFIKGKKNV